MKLATKLEVGKKYRIVESKYGPLGSASIGLVVMINLLAEPITELFENIYDGNWLCANGLIVVEGNEQYNPGEMVSIHKYKLEEVE